MKPLLGDEHPQTLTSAGNLALSLSFSRSKRKHAEAERILREVLSAIEWLPDLIPEEGDETTEGVVYQDRHAEGILWYVGKTGGKTALRRKPPEPTEPWVLTKAERKRMQEWLDEHMRPK